MPIPIIEFDTFDGFCKVESDKKSADRLTVIVSRNGPPDNLCIRLQAQRAVSTFLDCLVVSTVLSNRKNLRYAL